ncbi:DUF6542 domain-containing protein [Geodermatophilus sp. SYSU D01119]
MASASAADTWRDSGSRGERPSAGPQAARPDPSRHDATPARASRMSLPPVPPPPPRRSGGPAPDRRSAGPAPDRRAGTPGPAAGPAPGWGSGRPVADSRPPAARPQQRTPYPGVHPLADRDTPEPPRRGRAAERPQQRETPRGSSRTAPAPAPGLRGSLAVLGIFVITLAGGAVDSFLDVGLGTLTLITLVAASAVATLLVRKRDLLTVVVAPPLVFVAVAAVNVGLAPSADFTVPTIATVLIRGFPTMAVATGVAVVLGIIRWAARR